ncbi:MULTISPECIES: M20 aminoacylase family protein [unclassified Gilliamella]|uniref:M20 aminoacylase family protein n=1 Tax=unclassified Gilliamella TaxID=2685620 RepID=UPI00226A5BD1|nr:MULTISPECIES: M20 aminoacylase family protein [unclassified Gilliamella]MCX8601920.1 amidohydrolase [Gilliamella sp. B3722]MCX8608061.1 amidohydrolase [Gilliamella sp. B3771]MCX8611188.1 amidohydrolase [Gilliamella sp. B3891]MCX8613688.1 amidohydrolase [Gilliamella sp. B3773]MCX8615021.1 amidohydrolase [Gilliamella sp. B3770]
MSTIPELKQDMIAWRHHIHAHPETAFEEKNTTQFIIEKLQSFGITELFTDFAPTGVVGLIHGKKPGRYIALRADIDALDIVEENNIEYCSTIRGKMHACGHDGHTATLLGVAKYLSEHRDFTGTVVVIFQPAEENEGGARVMVENGLFDKLPIEAVYGIHNQPNMNLNHFYINHGPMMASYDVFEIKVTGQGAHAAAPHLGKDTILTATQIVNALQSIVSRNLDPISSLVISVTQIHSGDTWNVLPQQAVIRGTVRSFSAQVQDLAENRIKQIASGIAATFDAKAEVDYQRRYPATINYPTQADIAIEAAKKVVGQDNIVVDPQPSMGSEDFAFMLQKIPGVYVWLGAGKGANLHNPAYNFNDEVLTTGAQYFVEIVNQELGQ